MAENTEMRIPTGAQLLNFARVVQPVYALLQWEWCECPNEPKGVPSVDRIYKAVDRLTRSIEAGATDSTSGGLYAHLEVHEDGTSEITFGMTIDG